MTLPIRAHSITYFIHRPNAQLTLRKRLLACALLAGLAAVLPACSAPKPDVEVTLRSNELYSSMTIVGVQAKDNAVTINDLTVNRGNWPLVENSVKALNQTVNLKYGESWNAYPKSCSVGMVKEVEVTTDKGTFTFSF